MKKAISLILTVLMCGLVFTACGNKEELPADEYSGVLTKVRLGMPFTKVVSLNSGCELYYENDTQIWCVNTDTDLMEIAGIIPPESQFYGVDDSLITYDFRYDEGDDEKYLTGYLEEVTCMLDRQTAWDYYEKKILMLQNKYGAEEAYTTLKGTEGVDLNLDYTTIMVLPSFEVDFVMELTYDTVDAVDDYYATYFSIEVKELKEKTPVGVKTSGSKDEE